MNYEELISMSNKLKESMPPKYRVHVVEGVTQFIAFDGRIFVGELFAKKLTSALRKKELPTIADPLFGFRFYVRLQSEIDLAGKMIRSGQLKSARSLLEAGVKT